MRLPPSLPVVVGLAAACAPVGRGVPRETSEPPTDTSHEGIVEVPGDTSSDVAVEVPGTEDPGPEYIFTREIVHSFEIALSEASIASLTVDPGTWVEGAFTFEGRTWDPVAVHLKGNSSFEGLDGKPAWKVKFNEYNPEGQFFGLERLTLNNNVWDPTNMSETLAYGFFRDAGSPAPRTGYATVGLNGTYFGLYTIVEATDDVWAAGYWPEVEGGLYEMTRSCDFTSDCTCFELEDASDDYDPASLAAVCDAVKTGQYDAIRAAFEWTHLMAFFAAERVINHPDSYTYNLNNYYFFHDTLGGGVSLSPWGADSAFVYWYPPDNVEHPCTPMGRYDNLRRGPYGALGTWCEADASCRGDLYAAMSDQADLLERLDLAGEVTRIADRIRPWIYEETRNPHYRPEHFEYNSACFAEWIARRPAEVRDWLGE